MKILNDYSWIKGFNYVPSISRNDIEFWRDYDEKLVEKELKYAQRLRLNCVRPFLSYVVYKDNPEKFLSHLLHFVRTADSMGIYTMPVVWDSCFSEKEPSIDLDENEWFANPGTMYLGEKYWSEQEVYCSDLIKLLKDEHGLLMWDIHNEPLQTSYVFDYEGEEKQRHIDEIWKFVRHYCEYFKEYDKVNPVTVGIAFINQLPSIHESCDVLSFHDYSATREKVDFVYKTALNYSQQYEKPIFCSEMGCPARANPYDIAIEVANENKTGYILWELMIGKSFWNDRHGIVYPDGTVRDPAIVAAVLGFFRSHEIGAAGYNLNTEGLVATVVNCAMKWLEDNKEDLQECKQILEVMCNLIESGQLLPMYELPSVQLKQLKDTESVADLMKKWITILSEDMERCQN